MANRYEIGISKEELEGFKPFIQCLKVDTGEDYIFLTDIVDCKFENFEFVEGDDEGEYFFCYDSLIVVVNEEKIPEDFMDYEEEDVLEIDFGIKSKSTGDNEDIEAVEFQMFIFEEA